MSPGAEGCRFTSLTPSADTRRLVTTGFVSLAATIDTARSTDSSGRTNCAVPLPSSASRSTSAALRSAPTPNEKILLSPRSRFTLAAIASGFRSPTVGSPSVTNRTSPSLPDGTLPSSAASSAPEIFVEPDASSDCRYLEASRTFSLVALKNSSRNVRTSVEKSISLNRSDGLSVDNSCFPASRACLIFTPDIDPDTSSTSVTSRGVDRATIAGGERVISANPSSFRGAYVSTEIDGSVDFLIGMRSVTSLAPPSALI